MAKSSQKLVAQRLRKEGLSIKQISERVGISKSTASIWCQEVSLTVAQKERLFARQIAAGHKGRMMGAEANRKRRLERIEKCEKDGSRDIARLTSRDKLMLGLGLYWGEGAKARTSATALINSDPKLILFGMRWFIEQLNVDRADFRPYIYIAASHRGRAREILAFWVNLLDLPSEQFAKIVFLKGSRRKVYENHDSYYGVLALRVSRGTLLKYRVLGLLKACQSKLA